VSKRKRGRGKRSNRFQRQAQANQQIGALLASYRSGELSDDELTAGLDELVAQFGRQTVSEYMFRTLKGYTDGPLKAALMVGLSHIADQKTVSWLWDLVRSEVIGLDARGVALVILQELGEDVDPSRPGLYFSPEKITPQDIQDAERFFEQAQREIIRYVQRAESTDEIERIMMMREEQVPNLIDGEDGLIDMLDTVAGWRDTDAADYLLAVLHTTPRSRVREAAREGLQKLANEGIEPQSSLIKALANETFFKAYTSDPDHPWQQNVMTIWERQPKKYQVMSFLLDFGRPWNGAIKDMLVTYSLSWPEIEDQMIKASAMNDVPLFEIDFDTARSYVLEAFEANRRNSIKLPAEYDEFRHMFERRFVDVKPSQQPEI
jgi:hypothetical protein